MEALLIILAPGLFGGLVVAFLLSRFARIPSDPVTTAERLDPPSTGMINMAHIRVAGAGGLGMVAMSVVVAIFVPRIRFTMALAFVLGCVMAAVLVAVRRREGDSPSGIDPGAHVLFPLDQRHPAAREDDPRSPVADALDLTPGGVPGAAAPSLGLAV